MKKLGSKIGILVGLMAVTVAQAVLSDKKQSAEIAEGIAKMKGDVVKDVMEQISNS